MPKYECVGVKIIIISENCSGKLKAGTTPMNCFVVLGILIIKFKAEKRRKGL